MTWKNTELALSDTRIFSGIYRIRIIDETGIPIEIGRLAKVDKCGIVYIGKGDEAITRVTKFQSGDFDHTAAVTWSSAAHAFEQAITKQYQFEYELIESSDQGAVHDEKMAIWHYFQEFGEVPPLNGVIPGGRINLYQYLKESS